MTSGISDSGTYANNMRPALGFFERLPKLTHTIRYRTFLFPFSSRYARQEKGWRRGELGLTRKKKRAEAGEPASRGEFYEVSLREKRLFLAAKTEKSIELKK